MTTITIRQDKRICRLEYEKWNIEAGERTRYKNMENGIWKLEYGSWII